MDATTALAIYRAEKDKALRERRVSHVQLMAEAQEAFRKMLADAQLARKGGRPKGSTNAAASAPVAAAAAPTAATVPGKLVLKTSKSSPAKSAEKVTASKAKPANTRKSGKAVAAASAQRADKRASEKRRPAAKQRAAAKSARRAAAPAAHKGSVKKAAPHRKQAASRERTTKGRRR